MLLVRLDTGAQGQGVSNGGRQPGSTISVAGQDTSWGRCCLLDHCWWNSKFTVATNAELTLLPFWPTDTRSSTEEVQDIVWAMFTGTQSL